MAAIYNHYVQHTAITFEQDPLTPGEIAHRLHQVHSDSLPWLVAEEQGKLLGYAYATPWKARAAYRFSVEVTVYVSQHRAGLGIGSLLYGELFPVLENAGIHAAMGCIALPNPASIALHEKFGMQKAAHFHEVGFKFDRWIDVGYWQRVF